MTKYSSLSTAVKDGLAIKDEHGYLLPFQGGRFRINDDNDIVDTGIVNAYPTSAERFKYRIEALVGAGDDPTDGGGDPSDGGGPTSSFIDLNGQAGFTADMLSDFASITTPFFHYGFDTSYTSNSGSIHIIGGNNGQELLAASSDGRHFRVFTHNNAATMTTFSPSFIKESNVVGIPSFDYLFIIGDFTYALNATTNELEVQSNTPEFSALVTSFNPVENSKVAGVYATSVAGKHVIYSLHYLALELIYVRSEVTIGADGEFTSMKSSILNRNLQNTINSTAALDIRLAYINDGCAYFKSESERIIYVTDLFGQRHISSIENPAPFKIGGFFMNAGKLAITYEAETDVALFAQNALGVIEKDADSINVLYTTIEVDKAFPFGAVYSNSLAADIRLEAEINKIGVDASGSRFHNTSAKSNMFRNTDSVYMMGTSSTNEDDRVRFDFPIGTFEQGKNYTLAWCTTTVSHTANPNTYELMRMTGAEDVPLFVVRWSGSRITIGHIDYFEDTVINMNGELHITINATWSEVDSEHRIDVIINDRACIPESARAFYVDMSKVLSVDIPGLGNDVTSDLDFGTVLGCNQKVCDFTVFDQFIHPFSHSWRYLSYMTGTAAGIPETKQVDEFYLIRSNLSIPHSSIEQISFLSSGGVPLWGIYGASVIVWEYTSQKIEEGQAHSTDISTTELFGWVPYNIQAISHDRAFIHNGNEYGFIRANRAGEGLDLLPYASADYDLTGIIDGDVDNMSFDYINRCIYGTMTTSGDTTAVFVVSVDDSNKPVALVNQVDLGASSTGYGKPASTGTHYIFASYTEDKLICYDRETGTVKELGSMNNLNGISTTYCDLEINEDGYLLASRSGVGTEITISGIVDSLKGDFTREAYHDALMIDEKKPNEPTTKINNITVDGTAPDPDPTPDPDPDQSGGTLSDLFTNGSNVNSTVAKYFYPTKVADYKVYKLNHSIPLKERAVNIPSLSPVPINLAYLYALSRKPIVHSDAFLLTPGNLMPYFYNGLEGPLTEDGFEWRVTRAENVIDPGNSNVLGVSFPSYLGVALDTNNSKMYCMYSGEEVIAGTNREEVLLATTYGDLVTVTPANLIAYLDESAEPGDGKEFQFIDSTDTTFNPSNIEEVVPRVEELDPESDFVKGN